MTPDARWLSWLLAALLPWQAGAQAVDPAHSRAEFDLRTRWGRLIEGEFPRPSGMLETLPDGRQRVRLRLATAAVVVEGSRRYTRMARGPDMFDADQHPWVEFVSDPFDPALAHTGGPLDGELRMHGVSRRERFELAPASCSRPGLDCPVLARGRVSRDDYALDGWQWALADRVRFRLHVRLAEH